MKYNPGTHLIATLSTKNNKLLGRYEDFQKFVDVLIEQYQLKKLGEVYHNFSPEGFTAVVCLSESHLSIHTWPEHGLVNIDIYLSNYLRVNDGVVSSLYNEVKKYFDAQVENELMLKR